MASPLTIQERVKIAIGRHATLRPETVRNCHAKLMTTESVNDKQRRGHPSTSQSPAKVAKVKEMFD